MATTNPTDPNKIRLTGENSFIRLTEQSGETQTTRASHWRVLWSPGGPGHVLFLQSELTDDQIRIYSDNIALARWLQEEIETFSKFFRKKNQTSIIERFHQRRTGQMV